MRATDFFPLNIDFNVYYTILPMVRCGEPQPVSFTFLLGPPVFISSFAFEPEEDGAGRRGSGGIEDRVPGRAAHDR